MPEIFKTFLSAGGFIPHGHCYLWKPGLVWLHVVSDSLIALAYYLIPVMLVYFVRNRRDVPFDWVFLMFGAFIVACGTTHLLEIWTLWHPTYWLSGFVKAFTALVSLYTAVLLVPLIPQIVAIPSPAQLEETNQTLRNEITQRQLAESALRESEERLQALLDNAPAVIYLKDAEGRLILVNREFENLFQISKEEVLGKSDYELFPAHVADAFRANDQQVLEAGTPIRLEEVAPQDDGLHTYISIKFPLYNSSGVICGLGGISTDITERKEAEEKLQQLTVLQNAILDFANYSIISTSVDGIILTFNAAAEQWLGYTADEVVGKTTPAIIHDSEEIAQRARELSAEMGVPIEGFEAFVAKAICGTPDEREWSYIRKDGSRFPVLLSVTALRDAEGNITGFLGVGSDITEPKRAEEALRKAYDELEIRVQERTAQLSLINASLQAESAERQQVEMALQASEQQFRATFNQAAVGIAQVGTNGQWLRVNQKLCDIVGYSSQELLELTFQDITYPDDLEVDLEYVHQILAGEIETYSMEKRYIRKDSSLIWINLTVSLVRNSSDEPQYFVSVVEDISDRKHTEETLKQTQFCVDSATDAISWVGPGAKLIYVNDAMCRALGYSRSQLLSMSVPDIDPDAPLAVCEELLQALQEHGSLQFESRHRRQDGSLFPVEIVANYVNFQSLEYACCFARDISDRKRQEEEIRLLQTITQAISDAPDFDGAIEIALRKVCEMTGWNFAEAWIPQPHAQILELSPAWYSSTPHLHQFRQASEELTFPLNTGIPGRVWASQQPEWIQDVSLQPETVFLRSPMAQEAGIKAALGVPIVANVGEATVQESQVLAVFVFFTFKSYPEDKRLVEIVSSVANQLGLVLQRKRAEETLRESEQRFRAIFNQAAVGIVQIGLDEKFRLVNQSYCDLVGYTYEELLERNLDDLTHPDDRDTELEYVRRMLMGEIATVWWEKRYIRKDGSVVWVNVTSTLVRNFSGEAEYFLGVIEDITDRKRTEEEQQKLISLIENCSDFIGVASMEGKTIFLNQAGQKLVGLNSIDEAKEMMISDYLMEEDRGEYQEQIIQVIMQNGSWEGEHRFRHVKTNQPINVHQKAFLLKNSHTGEISAIATVTRDITDRKLAEEALQESERRYATLARLSPVGIFRTDAQGQYLYVNKHWREITGLTKEEALGGGWVQALHPDDRDRVLRKWYQSTCQQIPFQSEYRFRTAQGQETWVMSQAVTEKGNDGEVISYIGMVADIRYRKQAEEELQKSYNLLQSVIESTADAILVKNLQGRYVMLNSAVASIQGKPKSEILGRDDRELFGTQIGLSLMETDGRIMATGKTEIVEEDVLIGGTLKTFLSTKSVWRDSQGNVIGLIVISRDISDRKRAEQEIRELNESLERRVLERTAELEAANKELEAFSYSVSHDLRAPLRGIDGFSQALLDRYADKLDDKGKHYLQRVRAGTQRMGELIDDLLQLSRVTRSEMHRTKVDLSALVQEIATELQQTQPSRQVEWAIASGLVADGDARLLRIVLENLLNNAWKFTSSRTHSRIEFNVIKEDNNGMLAYFVRDDGAGFNMAYANKLFGAFQRLHSTNEFPGTGIGLATVQRIIHRHGGRVWAEGAVDMGATFYFSL